MSTSNTANMKGFYEFYKNGELVGSTQNTLTVGFLSRFIADATRDSYVRCYCGSGTTTPDPTDVGIESFITGSTSAYRGYTNVVRYVDNDDSKPKVMYTYVFDYAPGSFTGSVAEVGVVFHSSTTANDGAAIDSHAQVVDLTGTPTTQIITSDDSFKVIARFVTTLPASVTGTMTLGATQHTVTWELLNLANWHGMIDATNIIENDTYTSFRQVQNQGIVNDVWYITSMPGTYQTNVTESWVDGGSYVDFTYQFDISQANLVAGIEYLQYVNDPNGSASRIRWGLHFSPKITDTVLRTMYFTLRWNFTINSQPLGSFTEDFSGEFV